MSPPCVCDPPVVDGYEYVEWIAHHTGECVYTPLQFSAFMCGMLALACFVVGLLPQMYKNYTRGDVSGLSLGLLTIWAVGDVTGLVGAVLTGQSVAQRLCAGYFVLLSGVAFGQYGYYVRKNKNANQKRGKGEGVLEESGLLGVEEEEGGAGGDGGSAGWGSRRPRYGTLDKILVATTLLAAVASLAAVHPASATAESRGHGGVLLTPSPPPPQHQQQPPPPSVDTPTCGTTLPQDPWVRHIGAAVAWISGLLYFSSRIPQLYQNHVQKSTAALSLSVFILTLVGNSAYVAAILLRQPRINVPAFDTSTLPFLVGSAGTLVFDVAILAQATAYRPR
ncbi:hypothetical protein PhCBS80983_g05104 [Powellomyces hirtus]|uniref:Uncharacterized protein n=1 Tax=Powellomyces hirtus TaxID=109895 RepID=A0A507DWJ5_9FUNG|nr:hypothetical protein PhCBS80983_g05104 [Powellomyces hirtus]